jgi:hypothetical protein
LAAAAGIGITLQGGLSAAYDGVIANHSGGTDATFDPSGNFNAYGGVTARGAAGLVTSTGATITSGGGVPSANCIVGSLYLRISARSASKTTNSCYPANTWTAVTIP